MATMTTHHPFRAVSFKGDPDMPLGCKHCGLPLGDMIHGPAPGEVGYRNTPPPARPVQPLLLEAM